MVMAVKDNAPLDSAQAEEGPFQETIRIVLADDHAVVRSGLRLLLDSESGFEVVAEAGDLDSARRYVRGHNVAGTTGNMAGTHPVAAPYPLNGRASAYNGTVNGPKINGAEWVADPSVTNNIRLFNDDGSGNIAVGSIPGRTGIECPSCHDVHNGSRVKDSFLVTGLIGSNSRNASGYLCLQCHSK